MIASALLVLALGAGAGRPAEGPDSAVVQALRERIERLRNAGAVGAGRAEVAARNALPRIYEVGGFQPFWTPARLDTLITLVRESAEDGLRPEDYHLAELVKRAPDLAGSPDPVARAEVDLIATDAFFLLLFHLYQGKVDPKSLEPHWNFEPRPVGEQGGVAFVLDALTQGRLREAVTSVRPAHWWYGKARAALAEYRALAAQGGWPSVPDGPALKMGMTEARVASLRRRLVVTGELSAELAEGETFDEPVAAAVREFQARHRISADGAVGKATLHALNVPVDARVLQIRINLERARWVLHEITDDDLVVVDVAGFEVVCVRRGEAVWRSKVQIGKPYRQTPIFKSTIDHVVFNPTWTIPPGILAEDTLPELRKDPGYLQRKGLEVVDRNGKTVDPAAVDWKAQSASSFPYMLRQPGGPDNALGRVKIMFPNPYFVYLHDTPSKALFEKDERAFSSGCMRVERPLELAEWVLRQPEAWNAQTIAAVVESGQTRTVRLQKPMPVLVMYWTIDPSVERRTVFKHDPYRRDPSLEEALDAPSPAAAGTDR
jgi:murein L,D-transpeptidase YcbB/YkuD